MIGYVFTFTTPTIARQSNSSTQQTQRDDMNSLFNISFAPNLCIETVANDDMQVTVNYVKNNIDRAGFFMILLSLMLDLAPHREEPLTE